MTEITQVKLDEMLAGLEGVTPGPWADGVHHRQRHGGREYAHITSYADIVPIAAVPLGVEGYGFEDGAARARHIARCDPDTMRAIIALASQALRSQGEAVDPDRALKDALFANLKAGRTSARYGGVLADKSGGMAWVSYQVLPKDTHPAPQEALETAIRPEGELDDELDGILVRPLRWVGPDLSGEYYTKNGLVPYKVRPQSANGFWLTEVGGCYPDENAAFIAAGKDHHALVSSVLERVEFIPAGHFLATKFADGSLSFQALPIEHADRAHVVELFAKTKTMEAVQR